MKSRRRLLLIGAVNSGNPPLNGEEYKNQLLCNHLESRFELKVVDTKAWRRNPLVVWNVVYNFVFPHYDRILVSASSATVHRLFRTLRFLRKRMAKTVYLVIGGYVHKGIEEGRYKATSYNGLSSIVVEGESMRKELIRLGILTDVLVMPNFKVIKGTWGTPGRFRQTKVMFVFLSRIAESKGIPVIFEALKDGRLAARKGEFDIDFYGPVEESYKDQFNALLESEPSVRYRGYLDINGDTEASYMTFAGYHVMLFPTTWFGEGFPGVVLDAMACGLPVIASDWNMNREVVFDGKTGSIIPPNDHNALADQMLDVLDDREKWMRMSMNCHAHALTFDADAVLQRHLPGILRL
jgi:glycosyltransferase involved in cell wall biosynthesis